MKVEDLRPRGAGWTVHAMPCHHAFAEALRAFIDAPGIAEDRKGWLFRTERGHKADALSERAMNLSDAWCGIRRRAAAAGITAEIGCHTFRATGITAYCQWRRARHPLAELPLEMALSSGCRAPPLETACEAYGLRSSLRLYREEQERSPVTSSVAGRKAAHIGVIGEVRAHDQRPPDPAGRLRWSVDEALRGVQHQQRGVLAALAGAGRADGH